MAVVHGVPADKNWPARLLTTDFCPWANRFLYWLKEPVGWFVLATMISVMVGLYVAPIGWILAGSLASVIVVGILWPAVAVRSVTCLLRSDKPYVHEDDRCDLCLAVRNRLPLPVWGLAVEGFLDRKREHEHQLAVPTVALSYVRALATSTYRFAITPELRGRYPDGDPVLTCSFPFGIWTARRKLKEVSSVTVWPKVFPIVGQAAIAGRRASEIGCGNGSGRVGDIVGLREYRRGDSMRQVNWVATARLNALIVTERSGPQYPIVDVIVDAGPTSNRDQLSDRIRVAASLLSNLHQSAISLRLHCGTQQLQVRQGWEGFVQMMNELADVPADGASGQTLVNPSRESVSITISSNHRGDITVCVCDPAVHRRSSQSHLHRVLPRSKDLREQLLAFWTEVRDAGLVA